MSIEKPDPGQNFGQDSELVSPFDISDATKRGMSDETRPYCQLADEVPGTRFILQSFNGVTEFTVHAWGTATTIGSRSSVYAKSRHWRDADVAIPHAEFAIVGASEDATIVRSGAIERFADLSILPIERDPIALDDATMSERDIDRGIAEGTISCCGRALVRLVERQAVVVPAVLSLMRQYPGSPVPYHMVFAGPSPT